MRICASDYCYSRNHLTKAAGGDLASREAIFLFSSRRLSNDFLNLFQALVLAPLDDVQDVLAELHVIFGLLKQETTDLLRVVFELIMLPGYVESRFRAVHGNAECSTVNGPDLFVLALPQLAVQAFGNVDA